MAMLISRATGNFTAAATWGVADSATGSQLTNPSASTNTTTSYVYSSTFTGTNTRVSDGIVLFLKRLNTTGTVTVALSDDNGVTATRNVTVNASDLPADESWVFFKFGSTLTLDGGTDYRVGVIASDAANAAVYRDATAGNWARMVSTTLTGAPAATDTMLIVGEWTGAGASSSYTVTMDNTATTDFGTDTTPGPPSQTSPRTFNGLQIGQNGTLTWGTSSATNYYLRLSGNIIVWSGGNYNMGTSGTPCPRNSTMTVLFDSTSQFDAGMYGFCAFNGSNVAIYGQSRTTGKNIVVCKLTADTAVNATSLTVDTDTGWLDNDEIGVAATSRTTAQSELGALNGNAGASSLTVDGFAGTAGGLAFTHSGTSPTQAEVANVSRNVVLRGNSTSQPIFLIINSVNSFNMQWCKIWYFLSGFSSSSYSSNTSSITVEYCSFVGVSGTFSLNGVVNYRNNVVWATSAVTVFGSFASTITNNAFFYAGFSITTNAGMTFSDNTAVSASTGMSIGPTVPMTMSNLTAHSCTNGITFSSVTPTTAVPLATLNTANVWRNTTTGIGLTSFQSELNNVECFGNGTNNILIGNNATASTINNSKFGGDTTFASTNGITFPNGTFGLGSILIFNNCAFSPSTGIYVANTTDINIAATSYTRPMITLNNTLLGAATEVSNPANLGTYGFIKSSKHDQTEGAFKSWFQGGIVERDTTIFNTAAPSERLTPSSASIKLASGSRIVAVDDLGTVTINAYVRKSVVGDGAAYNGNQPRLILKANPACGINADVVLDTMTAAAGSWEQLTGTTAAVNADGALEFYVDCDGTAGWVNVDDWSVT